MQDVITKEQFTQALTEGVPLPNMTSQSDIDGFCVRLIQFFTETPNNFWIDHDREAEAALETSFGAILTVDFGSVPTLRVYVMPGIVKFTLTETSLEDVTNQPAVGQAAMGVILFCAMESGMIERIDIPEDEDVDDKLDERQERRRALKEVVNPTPPRSGEKSYVLGGNKKFDIDWL